MNHIPFSSSSGFVGKVVAGLTGAALVTFILKKYGGRKKPKGKVLKSKVKVEEPPTKRVNKNRINNELRKQKSEEEKGRRRKIEEEERKRQEEIRRQEIEKLRKEEERRRIEEERRKKLNF